MLSPIRRGLRLSYQLDAQTRQFHSITAYPSYDGLIEFMGITNGGSYSAHSWSVEMFRRSLSNLYKSAETCTIDRSRWEIDKLSVYKSTYYPEHEYIMAHVILKQSDSPDFGVYMKIERMSHQPEIRRGLFTELFQCLIMIILSIYDKQIYNIEFQEQKLTLPQIVVLACSVDEAYRAQHGYNMFEQNCYWFTSVMIEMVKLIVPTHMVKFISKRKTGMLSEPASAEMIENVRKKYDEDWALFLKGIEDAINNPRNKLLKEARAKRVEAEIRRDEAIIQRHKAIIQQHEAIIQRHEVIIQLHKAKGDEAWDEIIQQHEAKRNEAIIQRDEAIIRLNEARLANARNEIASYGTSFLIK